MRTIKFLTLALIVLLSSVFTSATAFAAPIKNRQPAARTAETLLTINGDDEVEFDYAEYNGEESSEIEEWIGALFAGGKWRLDTSNRFVFENSVDGDKITFKGTWEYYEDDAEIYFEAELLSATLAWEEEDEPYLYIELSFEDEDGNEIAAGLYQYVQVRTAK